MDHFRMNLRLRQHLNDARDGYNRWQPWQYRPQRHVDTSEEFHESAYEAPSKLDRMKYAAYGVAGLVGVMGTDALTPNWLKSRGVTNEHSGTAKSQSLEPSS